MLVAVTAEAALLGLGALLTGFASLITAIAGIRKAKQAAEDECDKRISQITDAFERGMRVQPREDEEKWSHLP